MEHVILVNEQDEAIGTMEKMEAHRKGILHRAFSILLFNSKGEMLLQQRALDKYHSGGLWTNTCCSHPLPGETMEAATRRKLYQEMGIDLQPAFAYKFIYRAALDHDLIEHEYDHVYIGYYDGEPAINQDEVASWKYMDMLLLREDMRLHPADYTYWFRLIVEGLEFGQVSHTVVTKL
ncbi:isopentenyl-diphosphate Delta-isomerase [Fulvivirgaceae bacterium PWU5]|uniref:Isopentenyl-diphosphate delta-isomerase n=1 Tax=Dawidia cretensis TaxID=2782350 RepID=A0AAP2GNY3_9BACT|nr:isopentenyl-diphosphate Delta-isomerase [Dawidia cretensis]MBT1708011.1 isopentenyl-diphosphate Delta-isomerase [Dawidia cretensis]